MWKKVIITIAFTLLTTLCVCGWVRYGVSQRHLEQSRLELEQARTELILAQDRERDIAASIGRTSTLLSESISTVAELRETIGIIREEFERMENILRNSGGNSSCVNGDNDNTSGNTLTEGKQDGNPFSVSHLQ